MMSVDIANLTSQTAIFRAHIEEMQEVSSHIDIRSWEHVLSGEGEDATMMILLPQDQEERLHVLLSLVDSLR